MMTPMTRRKVAAKSRSENFASRAFSPKAAIDRLLQALSTMRPPEPNGTILEAGVDTRLPFFPPTAAGYSSPFSGDDPSYSMCRLFLVSRPLARFSTGMVKWLTPFQALMAIHFADAKENLEKRAVPITASTELQQGEATSNSGEPRNYFTFRACVAAHQRAA
ncbi:hypothetical protein [Sphingobium sp.]|uniref:hypothetical protein n=1 Tax=Sphingobium sp. TaxID=1912891 RepID=UPI00261130E8|nr:hypothetical protein [Sphingobium sp.]